MYHSYCSGTLIRANNEVRSLRIRWHADRVRGAGPRVIEHQRAGRGYKSAKQATLALFLPADVAAAVADCMLTFELVASVCELKKDSAGELE